MEKLEHLPNGQWNLIKSDINKTGYRFKHRSTNDGKSLYTITHKEHGNVGHAVVDHKTNTVQPTLNNKFDHHAEHIGNSVKAFHVARGANTDN